MKGAALVCLLAAVACGAASAAQPNFMVIVADDVGVNDIGAWGAPTIATPNIDRMTSEGLKLTQFYSAAPICSPSRASMLTGRLPIRTGVYTNLSYPLDLIYRVFLPSSVGCMPVEEVTTADHLGAHGYYTAMIGKWHLGHNPANNCTPNDQGFDYFLGLPYSHEEGFPGPELESVIWPPVPLFENRDLIQQPVDMTTLTPRYTNKTLELLDNLAVSKQPFFITVGYEEAHVPLFASPEFQGVSLRGEYGDTVQQMDSSIGKILDKLRDTGLDENTYVIFTSDNGAWIDPGTGIGSLNSRPLQGGSNAPFRGGKGSTWEGGVREPAVVWAPGRIAPGSVSMEPLTMMDFMPTFSELAGIGNPPGVILDGRSFASILPKPNEPRHTPLHNATPVHEFIFYWREHVLYATRYGPYKAHFFTRPGFKPLPPKKHDPPLLFQVEHDPAENLPINVTEVPEIINTIIRVSAEHVANITRGVSQYEDQNWAVVPCCDHTYNKTQADGFWAAGEYGLAVWDKCVCSSATTRPVG